MKSKELRVGNLVTDITYGFIYGSLRIESIMSSTLRVFVHTMDHETLIEYKLESIRGIPLTEEWIKAFGFENDCITAYLPNYNGVQIGFFKDGYIPVAFGNLEKQIGEPLKYVHQLQNLFFVILGKELTLKP